MNTCLFGDCRDSMRQLIANKVKVQMCVTSPPYFGLRDYGVDGQLGLESTPREYVSNMVEVFRLVRELLAKDGTCWVNIGDSYASSGTMNPGGHKGLSLAKERYDGIPRKEENDTRMNGSLKTVNRTIPENLKPKDLIGIPWRLAFALQDDGWYLRQDIIWSKPNPMPESVKDRCTKAHEYIFLLSKSERYYFDYEAIKEQAITAGQPMKMADGWDTAPGAHGSFHRSGREKGKKNNSVQMETRNKRSVWEVATQPYSGAHYATFPPALIEPCILAGSRPGDIVLDPFLGSGTTGEVSQNLGRRWIGCELNGGNSHLQHKRTKQQGLVLEAS